MVYGFVNERSSEVLRFKGSQNLVLENFIKLGTENMQKKNNLSITTGNGLT